MHEFAGTGQLKGWTVFTDAVAPSQALYNVLDVRVSLQHRLLVLIEVLLPLLKLCPRIHPNLITTLTGIDKRWTQVDPGLCRSGVEGSTHGEERFELATADLIGHLVQVDTPHLRTSLRSVGSPLFPVASCRFTKHKLPLSHPS
eukprot:872944-Rhodomonas_salina.4